MAEAKLREQRMHRNYKRNYQEFTNKMFISLKPLPMKNDTLINDGD
ncbi:hypothetical protein NUACC26_023910 [Scytonema sp. NUACC26]